MSTEATTEMMNEVIARFMGGTRIQHPEQIFLVKTILDMYATKVIGGTRTIFNTTPHGIG